MKNVQRGMKQTMAEIIKRHHVMPYDQLMRQVYDDSDVQSFIKKHRKEMSHDDLVRSAPKLHEYVQERNKLRNGKSGLMPGYVPRLVFNDHSINITYQPTQQMAEEKRQRALEDRVHSVALPKQDRHASLKKFDHKSNDSRAIIWGLANTFISDYVSAPSKFHCGMYIYGRFGVGKTYLLAAMARALAKRGVVTTLVHFPTFAIEMKASIQDNTTAQKIRSIEQSPILMLDDIGADDMSAWIRDDVFSVILEYRMQNEMPTFFSSNFSMAEFAKDHLSIDKRGDEEPLKAQRIMERIRFLSKEYQMLGPDRRNFANN